MKRILIRSVADKPGATTKEVLTQVLMISPVQPITIAEMRHRVSIQEEMENATDHVLLEDADWKVLCEAIENFPWNQASRGLLQILDDVLKAETVDKTKLRAVENG